MAYYRRRRSSRTARGRYSRSTYRRRRTTRRRTPRARQQRIVIQVVGGPGGVATSPISIGMKTARPVRRRF